MARLGRPGLIDDQKQELWSRWRKGESLSDIGRALEKQPASIFGMLRLFGGYCPSVRKRAQNTLSLEEREEISRGFSVGLSLRQIERDLDRSPSTISREIQRNGGMNRYRANIADSKAWDRARKLKLCRLSQ